MRKQQGIFNNIDWVIVGIYLVMVLLGWMNIYSAAYNPDHASIFDFSQRYGKQMLWIGIAFLIAILALIIEGDFFSGIAYIFYGITILLLLAVLVLGKKVNGARAWIDIGGFSLQPAEFAKFATCLAISKYLSAVEFKIKDIKSVAPIGALILLPVVLIMLQPDVGSDLVFASFVFVLYREGLPGGFLLYGFLAAVLFVFTLIIDKVDLICALMSLCFLSYLILKKDIDTTIYFTLLTIVSSVICLYFLNHTITIFLSNTIGKYITIDSPDILVYLAFFSMLYMMINVLINRIPKDTWLFLAPLAIAIVMVFSVNYAFSHMQQHQQDRINILLGKKSDPKGTEFNIIQSKIAIGSGGVFGKGYLEGTQTRAKFVPEQSTDFIFCTVGEEWGFVGSLIVIALFLVLLIRIIHVAERQRSVFTRVYGYGVASILFFHLAINVGMAIGLAPVIGIPLPFFSYGGSSLWSFTILLFVFVKLDAYRFQVLR